MLWLEDDADAGVDVDDEEDDEGAETECVEIVGKMEDMDKRPCSTLLPLWLLWQLQQLLRPLPPLMRRGCRRTRWRQTQSRTFRESTILEFLCDRNTETTTRTGSGDEKVMLRLGLHVH